MAMSALLFGGTPEVGEGAGLGSAVPISTANTYYFL